jgi:ribosome-associated heat shock protein Hsp15
MVQRLDLWLDIACLFKTRSEAQKACKNGKIDVNGQPAKPHRVVKAVAVAEKHLPKAEARELYKDLTPPPSPEELEARKMARLTGPFPSRRNAGAPDKRVRRELRRLKEKN